MRLRLKTFLPVLLILTTGCDNISFTTGDPNALSNTPPAIAASALQAGGTDPAARALYGRNGWAAIWSPRAQQALIQALDSRAAHGLDRVKFLEDVSRLSPAAREIVLTRAALRFASALAHGVADPEKLHAVYRLPRPKVDIAAGLVTAAQQGTMDTWLAGLTPQTPEYKLLSDTYLQQRKDMGAPVDPKIPVGDTLEPGDSDARVPQIVAALVENRYLPTPPANGAQTGQGAQPSDYTPAIVKGVKALQEDYGIGPDGVIGPDTLAVLNVQPADRARSLAVALERLRWLSRSPPATRIDVNIAAAEQRYFRDNKLMDQRVVVVGQPDNETPQIESAMFRLVANPTWTVPKSIQNGEMAGKGAAYFRRNNMALRDGWVVQQSGPGNALGLVKFDMQNDLAIYLHDTPAKTLFDQNQRQLSHGCVRVSDALGFAQMLAEHQGIRAEWEKARRTGDQSFVSLKDKIPVRLMYNTVYVGDANQVTYRTDPYGWNLAVAQALGFAKDTRKQMRRRPGDVGP